MGNLIFSPDVYDMMMISDASSDLFEIYKGYTMQRFVAVYDGSKIFNENQLFQKDWSHQKKYLISLFQVISKLLDKGICMTDLKDENTLYDGENGRGMLIDLAGVVRKENRNELAKCKVKYINELTKDYTDPNLYQAFANAEDEDIIIDLPKCMSFGLGKIIKKISLDVYQENPFYKTLEKLFQELTQETSQRISRSKS